MSFALHLGLTIGLIALTLPPFWVCSRLALRTAAPTIWLRRLLLCVLPVAGGSYLTFLVAGVADTVRGASTSALPGPIPPTVQSIVADTLAQFTLFASTAIIALAGYAVTVPAIRSVREIELSTSTAVHRLGRYALLLVALLTVAFVPFERMVTGEDVGVAAAMLVLLVVLVPFVSPLLMGVFRQVRSPTPAEGDRLDRLCDRAGLDVTEMAILTDADETLEIYVRGLPGRRRLFVSAFALTALDQESLGALLAVNAGSVESHHAAIRTYPILGFVVAGVLALVWESVLGYAVVVGLALLLPLPVLAAARRAVRRADDYAAERVGRDAVADALERSADVQRLDIPTGGLGTILKSRPPLQARIDRLRDASS